jgi:hypothetical protein
MKAYELLKSASSVIMLMQSNGLKVNDGRFADMYTDYTRLCGEGHKKTWIVQYLCDNYGLSQTQFYRLIQRLGQDIHSF